jgi:hypothetical protein
MSVLYMSYPVQIASTKLVSPADSTVLDMEFSPVGKGKYTCDVVLRGPDDIRVYRVEVCLISHHAVRH